MDDCLVLVHAYAQFGLEAEVRIAESTIADSVTASRKVQGSLEPRGEDGMIYGHTVVWLPAQDCLVDPRAEQHEEIAAYREGPVIATTAPSAARDTERSRELGGPMRVRLREIQRALPPCPRLLDLPAALSME